MSRISPYPYIDGFTGAGTSITGVAGTNLSTAVNTTGANITVSTGNVTTTGFSIATSGKLILKSGNADGGYAANSGDVEIYAGGAVNTDEEGSSIYGNVDIGYQSTFRVNIGKTGLNSPETTGANEINIGTAGSATSVNLGSASGTSQVTINGTLVASLGKKVIQTIALSGTTSIAFTSIPATYRDLEIHIVGGAATMSSTTLSMTLNGTSTGVYSYMNQYISLGSGTSSTAPTASNGAFQTSIQLTATTFNSGANAHLFASIYDYAGASHKSGTVSYAGSIPAAIKPMGRGVYSANITDAITSITIAVAGTGGLNGTAVLIGVY
jgi:hypothetical protein